MNKLILLPLFFLLASCASYVQSLHRQISNAERAKTMRPAPQARTNQYARAQNGRPINNPVTLGNYPSANAQSNYAPRTKRNYNQSVGKRRYTADDLKDNDRDGSLWTGNNSKNFLFVTNNLKREGDIVIIEVTSSLKDTIQDELKRAFPDAPRKKSKGKKGAPKAEEAPAKTAQAESSDPDKVYDKISTKVVEQINQQYLLLRGRKEVLFKKKKRYFEIQAIVSRKDINAKDSVESTKILEPKINVLRY